MTIRRREDWGAPGEIPGDLAEGGSDAEAARCLETSAGCVLVGGDMFRTLGGVPGTAGRLGTRFVVDLLEVAIDGRESRIALASVVVRRAWPTGGWWTGGITMAMNAEYLDGRDVAPRGHPNDGRFEMLTVDASMRPRERWRARRRAIDGTHLPHPLISVMATARATLGPGVLLLDGRRVGAVRSVDVTVRPDAAEVWIRRPD